ncbi:DUF1963 domain-containing protein [Ensifer sp. IC4062]|nr:DUF1963 domain-containing protein [Ensifer sp. IC4062]
MKSLGHAFVVVAFMALLAVHFDTGLLASFTDKTPRAVRGIDTVIQAGLVSWLGHANTLALMAFLTLLLPIVVYFRNSRDDRQSQTEPATVSPARVRRVVAPTPKADIRPEDKQFMMDLLDGVIGQVERGLEMMKANERPKPFVRLVPQVPILPGAAPRSWFGGNPSLPAGTEWPTCDGKPAAFLAQIDCSTLPADLWDGAGPSSGWLSFFLGYENGSLAAKVLHTQSPGAPTQPPSPVEFDWLSLRETPSTDWTSLIRKDVPQWPVDVAWVPLKEEDPLVRPKRDNDNNPRFVRYRTGFDLNEPGWKPFDWATTLLMLDTATAHARETARRQQRYLENATKTLEQLSTNRERYGDPDATRRRAEEQAARAIESASAWKTCLPRVEALRAEVAAEAASRPFSEASVDDLIATLAAMTMPDRNREQTAQAFPTVCPPQASALWLGDACAAPCNAPLRR